MNYNYFKFQQYWNKLEWIKPRIKTNSNKPYSFASRKVYINKDLRMAHWVGLSPLKELDYNDFFDRKQMVEDLEVDLTGALKYASNTDDVALAEVADSDEAITAEAKATNDMKNDLK